MKSGYKRIGNYIRLVDERNRDLKVTTLLGLSIEKVFIASVANIIGSDMANYKIIRKGQFACSLMQVRRDKKIPVALLRDFDEAIISQAYPVFEIIDRNELDPEYLMMWMSRPEFDRHACFLAVGGVRGSLEWEDFCDMELPVPSIEKQREIVREYNTIVNRIQLNEQMNQKLEETAQAVYKHWFVDFEFPISAEYAASIGKPEFEGKPYKSTGGEMVFCAELDEEIPKGWDLSSIGQYSKVKSGYAFKSDWWIQDGIPVIKIGSIQNNSIALSDVAFISEKHAKIASKYHAKEGDIVIAMTGATIGKLAIIPKLFDYVCINQRVGIFDLGDHPTSKAAYLFFTMQRDDVQNAIKNVGGDSAQANVSNTQIENIKIITANNNEIGEFNRICKPFIENILNNQNENSSLLKLKEILMAKVTFIQEERAAA